MMRIPTIACVTFSIVAWVSIVQTAIPAHAELPLPVNELTRTDPVDFGKEILPILRRNCLACHNTKTPEGGLVLETLASIQKGGDTGPAVIAKDGTTSLLITRGTGSEEPLMPPEDNDVGAKPLTPDELGLMKLWIEQGATGSDSPASETIVWQPIPESIRSVYSLDVSPDGQYAAIGRANKVSIVELANHSEIARLVDPSLNVGEVADVDLIQSIAFSPDGERIATGGFRSVRLWKKTPEKPATAKLLAKAVSSVSIRSDETTLAFVNVIGDVEIWDVANQTRSQVLSGQLSSVVSLAWAEQANQLVVAEQHGRVRVWDVATGNVVTESETNTILRDVDVSLDRAHMVTSTSTGVVQFFRVTTENEKTSITRVHESLGGVTDATAMCVVNQPSLLVVIAKESGGVTIIEPNENKEVRAIDHRGVVASLALSSDQTKLATGGRDGTTQIWNLADGAKLQSMESTPSDRLLLAQAQRDATRQKNLIARLTTKTGVLTETLNKEIEALAKVNEARDKAKEALAAEEKKHTDAVALVNATKSTLDKAKQDTGIASEMLPSAAKTMEVAMANAATTKQEIEALEKQLAEKRTTLVSLTASVAKSTADIEAANKLAAEAKAITEKATKELEEQSKAVAAAEAAKAKSEMELKNRQQAFDASSAAVELATAAIPTHQAIINAETRIAGSIDAELAKSQSLANQPGDEVLDVTFKRDATHIATVHRDGSTRVYRASDGLPTHAFYSPSSEDAQVAFLQDDVYRFYQNSSSEMYSTAVTWSLERMIGGIDAGVFVDRVTALQFRRDSQVIAVGGGSPSRAGDVKLFAVESGELVRDFGDVHSDSVLGLDFSPDGNTLASAGADRTIHLLDVASGTSTRTLEGHTHHVIAIAWHADGEQLASASADQSVKVWNVQTGEVNRTITGFPKELTSIQYVQGTNQVVIACANGQVRLSDTTNGNAVRNFDGAGDFLYTVKLTPDAQSVLSGGQSGTVRMWKLADGALLSELK